MIRWNKFISALLVLLVLSVAAVTAQSTTSLRRYVDVKNGKFENDGLTWASAKNNLQNAINDLSEYMATNNLVEGGEIFVAEGTYVPSESTGGTTTLFSAFKMAGGITIYGGFPSGGRVSATDAYIEDPAQRPMIDDYTYGWQFRYETILSGDLLESSPASFTWDDAAQNYTAVFPSNVYHVVWFASGGFDSDGAPIPLRHEAVLDGFTIKHGNASDQTFTGVHYSRGGGVYLVEGGVVRNCIITENSATERGGGIYLDGGGLVESCYIHRNIAPGGTGRAEGFGGGIAMTGGDMRYSMVVNNYAANGGGLAFYNPDVTDNTFDAHLNMSAVSSVVANNTAWSEGGGIYMRNGGVLNNMTVTANRCNGTGTILNGVQNGKSSGVYVENFGCIINSVFWGGTVGTTGFVQYYHRPDATLTDILTSLVIHSAFSDQAITEWTYTYRSSVMTLERENYSTVSQDRNYPVFINAPVDATLLAQSGVLGNVTDYDTRYNWRPASVSPLRESGRRISDISSLASYNLDRAVTTTDICGDAYSICPSLGAYVINNFRITPHVTADTVALFVDPEANLLELNGIGGSWDTPLVYLNVALSHFKDNADAYVGKTKRIYVKEGSVSPLCAYTNERYLSAGIQLVSDVEVYGGYAASLAGTDLSLRNPTVYRSVIDGKVGDGEYIYHCVIMREISNAILDGFHIISGDATLTGNETALIKNGGGIVIAIDPEKGLVGNGDMTGNVIRNCIIENCIANKGAALYAQPHPGAAFDLKMSNCVINNNTGRDNTPSGLSALYFDIPAQGNEQVKIELDHQTIVKNVGYAVSTTVPDRVSIIDSWVWSNAGQAYDDCTKLTSDDVLTLNNVTATYCAFDAGAGYDDNGNFSILTYNKSDATYPVSENPTRNIGHTVDGYNTYNGGQTNYMPSNMNPIINKACGDVEHTKTDITTVNSRQAGGAPDLGAYENSRLPLKGSVFYVRDYRNDDGTVDLTAGGDGLSWETAINGNAIYHIENGAVVENGSKVATTDARYTAYYDASHPYGEISNASKPFWGDIEINDITYTRTGDDTFLGTGNYYYDYTCVCSWNNGANGYEDNTGNNTYQAAGSVRVWGTSGQPSSSAIRNAIRNDVSSTYRITNTREEDYVGGLQYAVEKASAVARASSRRLEVWVAGGTYTDYKGFVIRDSVTVKGGFPNSGTPGDNERHPLIAEGIPLSDENSAYADRIADYETILQIQSTAPVTVEDAIAGRYTVSGLPSNVRKHVLYQPDVCLPTNTPVSNSHYHGGSGTASGDNQSNTQRNDYLKYNGATWDGFTIRHGFINGIAANRDGGAGVRMFQGVSLKNCVVRNNYNYTNSGANRNRGGGVYCESSDGSIENCFIFDNVTVSNEAYGGGMYMILGTGYNILVSRNYAQTQGGGIYIEDATFFNNTVAYNGSRGTGGMHQYTGEYNLDVALNVFNTLIYKNSGAAVGAEKPEKLEPFRNCYVQTESSLPSNISNKITTANNNRLGTDLANPFADPDAKTNNNYRLLGSSLCINAGLNEPTHPVTGDPVSLPVTDVDFADRIQDCTIDIGAYEYNGAYSITPAEESLVIGGTTHSKVYVYYVSYNGAEEGNASASSPSNAACWMKLQQVLDAAGRQKKQNPTVPCVVKVAGSKTPYAPRRTTVVPEYDQMIEEDEDVRSYALIVPRGVEVWGGYDETFTEGNRDIIGNKTIFKAEYVSAADTSLINTYHAVVFTDLLYDENGDVIRNTQTNAYDTIPASAGYAVLDGLFLTGGNADGSLHGSDNQGGGAIAESYTHIRNCVVQENSAVAEGGGLYLKAGAIVSGTLVYNNSANVGAGIYADCLSGNDSIHIVTSTVVQNTASGEGGGLFFEGRRVGVNSSVFWGNTANYAKDVYGNYNGDANGSYPFAYVAVENLQVPGLNNRSVSADNASGVRFVTGDPLFMIEKTSILAGSGMPMTEYMHWVSQIDVATHDFADRVRMADDNIDIGARALGYAVSPPEELLMQRIFVTDGTVMHPDLAQLLSANLTGADTLYQVRGASFVYPLYELHDALRYIKHIRSKADPVLPGVENRNLSFEIYLAGGTYIPREASDGTTVENARTSSFTIPEGVAIYGGFSGQELYCQETSDGIYEVAGIAFDGGSSDDYLNARQRTDLNGNSIIEPWEFSSQTLFSGRSNSEISVDGVYHVIYACANSDKVGSLPDLTMPAGSVVASGLPILIDGVTVTGGYAANLVAGDEAYRDNYYKGGAVCVDGSDNADGSSAKRYIPLTIRRSFIYGNSGILGGAIYNTGICSIFNSHISANHAMASTSGVGGNYAGSGGAVYVDGGLYSVNTLYANNEADNLGGVLFNESNSRIWVINCNLVRNKAAEYPCIYSLNPSSIGTEELNLTSNLVFNTAFWGNEAPANAYTINKWQSVGVPFADPTSADAPELLHFCAYEDGWDKVPEIGEGDCDKEALGNIENFKNNNVILTPENRSLYGPNFAAPSAEAGVAGYQEAADWSVSRINPMVDAGWGWAVQEYDDVSDSWQWPNPANTGGLYFAIPLYIEAENITIYDPLLPGIEDTYMKSHDGRTLTRVCLDPNKTLNEPGHNTYIDIGVYEYQHIPLNTDADTLYVCAEELPGSVNDGSSWETATSNLQRAIERLVLNRNGKDKILYMTEGDFAPIYTISKNGGFVIDTRYGSSGTTTVGVEKNVSSLRIAGGYNADNQRQPIPVESPLYRGENYKTIITSINKDVSSLFNIEDVANRQGNEQDETSDRPVIPIQIENITFENPYGAAFRYATSNGTDNAGALKLTLSGCEFRGSDSETLGRPVVEITGRGGRSLIYNTVFHSNRGVPLDAVDTEVFNATFAMNTGVPTLADSIYNGAPRYASKLYNSVLWRNGGSGVDQTGSEQITSAQLTPASAANTQSIATENIRYNAIQNLAATTMASADEAYKNDNLMPQNDDVISGPNFVNPYDGDLSARNFDISASAILLNKGDSVSYRTALGITGNNPSGYDITLNDLRVYDENIDRGAYENNQRLYPVLYVQPGKTLDGDGTTWENAFGQGRLQEAIDLCAVYVATRETGGEKATVFVKGGNTGESLLMRDGVSVYGSVMSSYTATVTDDGVTPAVTVDKIVSDRPGLLASTTTPTVIEGVHYNSNNAFEGIVVLDGFEVVPTTTPTSAVVSLAPQMVLRNNYVHGATITADNTPVIDNQGGLLYNMLVAGNETASGVPVVNNAGGTLVNLTIDAPDGVTPVVHTLSGQMFNTIVTRNRVFDSSFFTDDDLLTDGNPYNPYLADELSYQLKEKSLAIDKGDMAPAIPADFAPYVDYAADRDILGNARIFGAAVDYGCFETWNIKGGYKASQAPAAGSVVYVHDGNLVLENLSTTFAPGYLLLKEGTSLYGNGNAVSLDYVAVERTLGAGWQLAAFPYALQRDSISRVAYNGTTYAPSRLAWSAGDTIAIYDGRGRAESLTRYHAANSPYWVEETSFDAGEGFGLCLTQAGTYRFTGRDVNAAIYTETNTDKTVSLTQHNLTEIESDGTPRFTHKENMGWNLFGIPYLVASYDFTDMDLPHLLYDYDGSTYNTIESWTGGQAKLGDGYFTQTAIIGHDEKESLLFPQPQSTSLFADNTGMNLSLRIKGEAGADKVLFRTTRSSEALTYEVGRDGIKFMSMNPAVPQIYIDNPSTGTRFSLAAAVDEAAYTSVGVSVADSGFYTIDLPEETLAENYDVIVLIDNRTGQTTDLKESAYTFFASSAEDDPQRFSLAFRLSETTETPWKVYLHDHVLYVLGLEGGERIYLYDMSGHCLLDTTGTAPQFATPVDGSGLYIVDIVSSKARRSFKVIAD